MFAANEPVDERPRITYDSPDGWVEKETTTMRVASFSITKDGLPPADLSVIPLEGTGGGMLINIGQWRQQLGLAPIADEAMSSLIEEIDDGERVFRIVDLVSEKALLDGDHKARMLAAYLPTGGYAWFFKMVGEDSLVAAEKEAFIQFLKSARFPTQ